MQLIEIWYWQNSLCITKVSKVLITIKNKHGVNVGTTEGRLLIEKEKLRVIRDKNKEVDYAYISITSDNKLKYIYTYKEIGAYKVYVTYDEKQIKEKVYVTVSYQTIDLKSCKLYCEIKIHNSKNPHYKYCIFIWGFKTLSRK